jgi:hypothetical protein
MSALKSGRTYPQKAGFKSFGSGIPNLVRDRIGADALRGAALCGGLVKENEHESR